MCIGGMMCASFYDWYKSLFLHIAKAYINEFYLLQNKYITAVKMASVSYQIANLLEKVSFH